MSATYRRLILLVILVISVVHALAEVNRNTSPMVCAASVSTPDNLADLGNPEDEAQHSLVGWGQASHCCVVAPSGDMTKRYMILRGDNSLVLGVEKAWLPYLLKAEVEDGMCTDNFEIYVNGKGPIYRCHGTNAGRIESPDQGVGVAHEVSIPAEYISTPLVNVTFRNTSTDDCGLAAVYNVGLTPLDSIALANTINQRLQRWRPYPDYLKETHWHELFDLAGQYDEFYWAAVDYDNLAVQALIIARSHLDKGDFVGAHEYLKRSETYQNSSDMNFVAAELVFNRNLDRAAALAEIIRRSSEFAVKVGVKARMPPAGPLVDGLYLGFNFAIDSQVVGVDEAVRNAMADTILEILLINIEPVPEPVWIKDPIKVIPRLPRAVIDQALDQFVLTPTVKEGIIDSAIDFLKNLANYEEAKAQSPAELRVYDSQGRVSGLVNGQVRNETTRTVYFNSTLTIFYPMESYTYEVRGLQEGMYGLEIVSVKGEQNTTFAATNTPISANAIHRYAVDWDALSRGEMGVTIEIDSDGDGIPEETRRVPEFQDVMIPLLGAIALALALSRTKTGIRMSKGHRKENVRVKVLRVSMLVPEPISSPVWAAVS